MMLMDKHTTLGHSGLRVSQIGLGALTFGSAWGWGVEEEIARDMFRHYVESGGNFVDTADTYTSGSSETMIGKFVSEMSLRDHVVISTKYSVSSDPNNPNAGGNGRKNIYRALETSLRRLRTDYIDIFWVHGWDTMTPGQEVVSTLNDLIGAGKIRYYGLSDTPAWYVAQVHTLATQQNKNPLIGLQLQYSLVERSIEREHLEAAQRFGVGLCCYSPLAMGFLTGKYIRGASECKGRLTKLTSDTSKFSARNWDILRCLSEIASLMGLSPAAVALNWVMTQPGITLTLIGATNLVQLREDLEATSLTIPAELRWRLNEATRLERHYPYTLFEGDELKTLNGNTIIQPWTPSLVPRGMSKR
jgi:aryl-alcohol dehydrogenase-like predicted oxidoreductase